MNACPVRRVLPRWYCKRHRFVSVRDAAGCRTTVTKRVRKLRQARQIYSVRHGSIDQDNAVDRSRGSAVVFRLVLRRLRDGRRLPLRLHQQRARRLPHGTDGRSKSVPVSRRLKREGPAEPIGRCPLTGVDRKWLADRQNDAFDPNRTFPDSAKLKHAHSSMVDTLKLYNHTCLPPLGIDR